MKIKRKEANERNRRNKPEIRKFRGEILEQEKKMRQE
jgi:hypothetical protein